MNRRLHELRGPDVVPALGPNSVLVQPVGAIEQHGPHLPLSTDLLIAETLCERVVAERGDELDLWLLPPLAYTKSDEHAWSPGTVWLSATTMLAVLDDLGRSLATLPTKRLAFVNGHGGNSALLAVAGRELRRHHGLMTFLLHPRQPPATTPAAKAGAAGAGADTAPEAAEADDPVPDELGMGIHGGRDETSMVLHLRPDLVDLSLAVRAVPEEMAEREHVRFGGDVAFGWCSDDLSTTGAVGDPTLADAELGRRLVDGAVASLGDALAEVATFEFPVTSSGGPS
ncbi:creatininase family protein [Patulibacter sp. NPDC049589]|uniref:creatininase family protein n=1 Tax=Patulibacter sp. NPDC049589 TaxID=3154731 RepID=UPI0034460304